MIGEELRRARKSLGLTQEQLAHKAQLHRTYISQLERGIKSPTLDTLFRICDALGISPSEFIARVERDRR